MLVKNGFEATAHFDNHPEMLPHIGSEILIVGECVNLPGNFFADKAQAFANWYEESTPKHFDGLSDADWRMAKVFFDVRQTVCRNYDKYANPQPQRLFYEVSELYNKVIEETFDRLLNFHHMWSYYGFDMQHMHRIYALHGMEADVDQDAKSRWKACSYCTYYQRPNLTAGEFQEIMPGEDERAFEVFLHISRQISPSLILVLSKKASDSIKKLSDGNLPEGIHFFDSPYPSEWSKESRREFIDTIAAVAEQKAKRHLKNWLETTGEIDKYFIDSLEDVLFAGCGRGFARGRRRNFNPLRALDDFMASNAKYLLQRNPRNFSAKDENLREYRFERELKKPEIPWFNTYPLQMNTDKIFPLFLAICRGEEPFTRVPEKILEQAQEIIRTYPEGTLVKRNIVLLTDKWDEEIFSKYAEQFRRFHPTVKFIFKLFTESEVKDLKLNLQ